MYIRCTYCNKINIIPQVSLCYVKNKLTIFSIQVMVIRNSFLSKLRVQGLHKNPIKTASAIDEKIVWCIEEAKLSW